MKYNFDIFYNYEELINYFETPEISNICQYVKFNDIQSYFEKYYIMHFASCLGTSDDVEVDLISGDAVKFNINIITYTNENGCVDDGLTVDFYFFLVEKDLIENKIINHQIFHEVKADNI